MRNIEKFKKKPKLKEAPPKDKANKPIRQRRESRYQGDLYLSCEYPVTEGN